MIQSTKKIRLGAGGGSCRWRLIETTGRRSLTFRIRPERDPPWSRPYPPITLAANDATCRRLRASARALASICRSSSAHRPIKVNPTKSDQNFERSEIRHGADGTRGTFLACGNGFCNCRNCNRLWRNSQSKSDQIRLNPTKNSKRNPWNTSSFTFTFIPHPSSLILHSARGRLASVWRMTAMSSLILKGFVT